LSEWRSATVRHVSVIITLVITELTAASGSMIWRSRRDCVITVHGVFFSSVTQLFVIVGANICWATENSTQ